MSLRVTVRVLGAVLVGTLLSASACREERADTPAPPPAAGAPAGTGGATPSPGRDTSGTGGETPAEARDQAGVVAPTSAASGAVEAKTTTGDGATGGACTQDADCGLTRIDARTCCDECEERALLRSELTALEERCREQNEKCPARACAPGRRMVTAACREGRCEVVRGGGR